MNKVEIQKAQKIAGEVAEQLCANAYDISKEFNSVHLLECLGAMREIHFAQYTDKNPAILPIIVKLFNSQDKTWQYVVDRAFKVAIKECIQLRIDSNNDAIEKCKNNESALMPKRIELYERFNLELNAKLVETA
tara:strand:+ start:1124 stop:1525 length:402 start_codon:yes stop_codon:yes gene_type:complete